MPNFGSYISGAFNATYNGSALGPTVDGWRLEQTVMNSLIERSDAYGEMIVDGFYQGCKYMFSADCQEYKAATLAAFNPYASTFGLGPNATYPIGKRMSDLAKAFVMNSTPGTPAAAAPASITSDLAIIAPGQTSGMHYTGYLREVPLVFLALPTGTVGSSGVAASTTFFTQT